MDIRRAMFLNVLSCLLCITTFGIDAELNQNNTHKFGPFRQMIISNKIILIGGAGGIKVLDRENMKAKEKNITNSNNWLLLFDEKREEIVQCNENVKNISTCSKFKLQILARTKGPNMTISLQNIPTYSIVNVHEINTSIVVIGVNSAKIQNISYGILSFNLKDFSLFPTVGYGKGPMNIERADREKYSLAFKSSFYHAPHVYFFFQVHAHNKLESSRIGKLCLKYENKSNKTGFYHSYEDMNMTCTYNRVNLRKIEYALDDGESVIVLFLHNNRSVICLYSWDNISQGFLEFRKSKLQCGNTATDGQYFESSTHWKNDYVNCFDPGDNGTLCSKGNKSDVCLELEGSFCNAQYPHTLVGGKGIKNENPYYVFNKTITALDIFRTYNNSVLYFGTNDGDLCKVYLHLEENPKELRSYCVAKVTSKIINVKVEKDGIFFLTENKIDKLIFTNCSIHKNCKACMDSLNPQCGWSNIVNSCSNNYPDSVLWIPAETGICIHFTYIPNSIQINTENDSRIDFDIMRDDDQKIPKEYFRCKVNEKEGNITENIKNNGPSCKIDIRSLESGNYSFEVKYKAVILANASIEFYRCPDLKTCKECTKKLCCHMGPINPLCGKPESILPIYEEEKCPRLDDDVELHLYANRPDNLTIRVRDFETNVIDELSSSNFTCEISQNDIIEKASRVLWGMNYTHFTCIGFQSIESEGPYKVRLKYNDLYFDNEVTLNVYTCGSFHNNKTCSKSQFVKNCQWTNGCCTDLRSGICNQNEDKVTIKKIYPASGPVTGRTSIIVTVNNQDDEPDYFFIDGAECTDIAEEKDDFSEPKSKGHVTSEEESSSKFSCITGEVSEPNNGKINISFKGHPSPIVNNTYFTYKNPGDIQNFYPNKGILTGNTTITITGQDISFEGPDRYII